MAGLNRPRGRGTADTATCPADTAAQAADTVSVGVSAFPEEQEGVGGDRLCVGDLTVGDHPFDLTPLEPCRTHVLLLELPLGLALGEIRRQEHPSPLTRHTRRDVEQTDLHPLAGRQSGLLPEFACREFAGREFGTFGSRPLRELPTSNTEWITKLFDELDRVSGQWNDECVVRFVDDAVDPV